MNSPLPPPLRFTKMHGCGNDFVVVDATRQPFAPPPGALAQLCDRRFGVGCDQVLVVQPPSAEGVDFDYRIFNADGSEVGQCGNGARALAVFIRQQGLSLKSEICVQTRTARMVLRLADNGLVTVDMGQPQFEAAQVPLHLPTAERYSSNVPGFGSIYFGAVSMGNPHAVIVVPSSANAPVATLGPALQAQRALFPEGVNVGFLQIISPQAASLRVFERGSGETLACGSGACAAFAVARQWGLLAPQATLSLLGGQLHLQWQGPQQPVLITGPAETVFTGEYSWTR